MVIDGKKLAEELMVSLKEEFKKFQKIVVAAIVVRKDAAAISFLKQKRKVAEALGVKLKLYNFPNEITTRELKQEIFDLAASHGLKGVIVQLPLPKKFKTDEILSAIPPGKDIDALGQRSPVLSPAVGVVKFIFEKYQVVHKSKKIVLVGSGRLVGKPIYRWLAGQGLKVFTVKKQTSQKERERLIKTADILISGVGKANLIPAAFIKKGAVVIDFGYDFKKGRIYGDVEQDASQRAGLFTPTPGGTGPLLVALLFQNLFNLLDKRA